jgi:hypothetical protein
MPPNLMAIDVGFSKLRPTAGIACLEGDRLALKRAGTTWESREAKIPKGFHPSIIAIDGPLLPEGTLRIIVATLSPSPFALHSTIVADPASVIMEWDWS